MKRWQTARAWAAVHATGPALTIMFTVSLTSLLFPQSEIEELGVIRLFAPVSVLLLLPTLAGIAVAIACENTARLPLPDPKRAVLARAVWSTAWSVTAILAANVGSVVQTEANPLAITRNVLLFTSIGLFMVWAGYPHLVWLPTLAYTLTCMMFGFPSGRPSYYWWAVVMKEQVTGGQMVAVAGVFLSSALLYIISSRRHNPFRLVRKVRQSLDSGRHW